MNGKIRKRIPYIVVAMGIVVAEGGGGDLWWWLVKFIRGCENSAAASKRTAKFRKKQAS